MWLAALSLLVSPALAIDTVNAGTLLAGDGGQLTLEIASEALLPGGEVAVYVSDLRPDPRTGKTVAGLRYAGDGRIVWVGEGLVQITLWNPDQMLPEGAFVQLGEPMSAPPTPEYSPPEPEPAPEPDPDPEPDPEPEPEPEPAPEAVFELEPEPEINLLTSLNSTTAGEILVDSRTAYASRYGDRRQAVRLGAGWSDDGFRSGAGVGGVAWRLYPQKGPGLVEIGLDGVRAQRWVAAEVKSKGEESALEPAVGYWLWTRLDTPGNGVAGLSALAMGVDGEGLALGFMVGVRTGIAHGDRIELTYTHRGSLGGRLAMDGRVRLSDPVRLGVRTRVGDLPRHGDSAFRQSRADAVLLVSADPTPWMTFDVAAGLGGYDLLFDDAGFVADGALEVRW